MLRSGAAPGDVVAVCGSLGWSGAGLALYAGGAPDPISAPVRGRHLARVDAAASLLMWFHRSPRPPFESGPVAADAGATSMIDISDGLVRDGARIAVASGVELALDEDGAARASSSPGRSSRPFALDVGVAPGALRR